MVAAGKGDWRLFDWKKKCKAGLTTRNNVNNVDGFK